SVAGIRLASSAITRQARAMVASGSHGMTSVAAGTRPDRPLRRPSAVAAVIPSRDPVACQVCVRKRLLEQPLGPTFWAPGGPASPGPLGQALPVQDQHRFGGKLEPAAGGEVGERLVDGLA